MITNKSITYYHKTLNNKTKLEEWTKTLFSNVWAFREKGSINDSGYEKKGKVEIRIPMEYVNDTTIFQLGDIIAIGSFGDITKQKDLEGKEFYNVTNIKINDFGNNPHIHLGGK